MTWKSEHSDPYHGLPDLWWQNGGWKPKEPAPLGEGMVWTTNPECVQPGRMKHDRTSWDVTHCDDCRAYSEKVNAERASASAKPKAEATIPAPSPEQDAEDMPGA